MEECSRDVYGLAGSIKRTLHECPTKKTPPGQLHSRRSTHYTNNHELTTNNYELITPSKRARRTCFSTLLWRLTCLGQVSRLRSLYSPSCSIFCDLCFRHIPGL